MLPKYKQNKNSSLKKTWGLLLTTWTINFFVWLKKNKIERMKKKITWSRSLKCCDLIESIIQNKILKQTEKLEATQCPLVYNQNAALPKKNRQID